MALEDDLIIKIGADAKEFDKELEFLENRTKSLENKLATGAKVSAVAFAGLSATVLGTTLEFNKFSRQFANVETLLDETSFKTKTFEEGVRGLKEELLKLGSSKGENFETLNQSLFDLISAGVDAETAMTVLGDAVNLAKVGATDTATAVKAISATLSSFGSEAGNTKEITEKFFTAQKFGITDIQKLATEFNKIAGLSKSVGLGFDEALASATALTANGAKPTAEAFTQMKAVLNSVILAQGKLKSEPKAVAKALSLQNIETVGLNKALEQFKIATGGNVVQMQRILGSAEALDAVLALTGNQAELTAKIIKEMGDEQNRAATYSEKLARVLEEPEEKMKRLKSSTNAAVIALGEGFKPLASDLMDVALGLVNSFNSLDKEVVKAIADFTKMALVFTGITAGSATLVLGFVKIRNNLIALKASMLATKVGARAMWGALTLGATTLIAFLPEIYAGFKAIFNQITKEAQYKNLEAINDRMAELDKQIKSIRNGAGKSSMGFLGADITGRDLPQIKELQKELDELKAKKDKLESKGASSEDEYNDIVAREMQKVEAEKVAAQESEALKRSLNDTLLTIDEDYRAMSEEDRKAFLESNIEMIQEETAKLADAEAVINQERLKRQVEQHNQYLINEKKYGKTFATLRKTMDSDQVKGVQEMTSSLIGLQQSRNQTLKNIGKAAAISDIIIRQGDAAMNAYAGAIKTFGVPAGPVIGTALAGAAIAFGAEQIGRVTAAADGGMITGGIRGKDSVPALLMHGELVAPQRNFDEVVNAVALTRNLERGNETLPTEGVEGFIEISFKDGAEDLLQARFIEKERLGI